MESQSQERLNPWLTVQQLEEINLYYTTMFTDENGHVLEPRYGSITVRNDITKLVAEVKRLQAIEAERDELRKVIDRQHVQLDSYEKIFNGGLNDHENN